MDQSLYKNILYSTVGRYTSLQPTDEAFELIVSAESNVDDQ